jgi:L-ornithine N5-oxygenase
MDYDVVGIGFGPANISLAVALQEMGWGGSVLFLERYATPDWQPGMLLDGTDIQHHPLRDLVTPRNPQSRYGFLSYLKSRDRLFDFLNLGVEYALRKDYAGYIRWVAAHFDHWVAYSQSVASIKLGPSAGEGKERRRIEIRTECGRTIRARCVSLAPGRSPLIPAVFAPHLGDRVVHFTGYLGALDRWTGKQPVRSIAVVGGSQSAIEIVLDLSRRAPGIDVHNVQRGFGYHLKDTSPFTEHAYFPDFVDYFYNSSEPRQQSITRDLWRSNYGAADHDVIHQLYLALYEQKLGDREAVRLHTNSDVETVQREAGGGFRLGLVDRNHDTRRDIGVDAVILATGFRNCGNGPEQEPYHPLLAHIAPHARRRDSGSLFVTRDYRLDAAAPPGDLPPIFVNGLCESTHGFGDAGSFSLLALRSWTIATSIAAAIDLEHGKPSWAA